MIPTGHYRPGRLGTVDLAVIHTAESSVSAQQLADYFSRTDRQVSCHSIVDDHGRVDVLPFTETAYAAPGANADGDQLELCGMAHWSRETWLHDHPGMLAEAARWLAERCRARQLPPVLLGPAELLADRRGITTHAAVSAAFHRSTHTDPGSGFPIDVVLGRVKTLLTPPTPVAGAKPAGGVRMVPSRQVPAYPGHPLRVGSRGPAVATWQRRMRQRGWAITVDGVYGPASAGTASHFQAEKHLRPVDGIVGPDTWRATWAAQVT